MSLDLPTLNLIAGIITSVLTSVGLIGGMIWRIVGRVNATMTRLEAEMTAADERARRAEDDLRRALEAHKLYAAEHFATEEGVRAALEPVLKAIDRLADRLDQLIAAAGPQRPPRTR